VIAVMDNLSLSLLGAEDPIQLEAQILDSLRRDYCYRLNKAPDDRRVPPFAVVERRLRVGLHNSLCYVDEPYCLYLSLAGATEGRPGSGYRKRSKSLGRRGDVREVEEYLIARNAVRLETLSADERMAVVFCLDFLVGVDNGDVSGVLLFINGRSQPWQQQTLVSG